MYGNICILYILRKVSTLFSGHSHQSELWWQFNSTVRAPNKMHQMLFHTEDSSLLGYDEVSVGKQQCFGWICSLPFRSNWPKKRWRWRQHAPLNGYVPIDTELYPRRLEFSTLLWEPQNFTLLHTSFHSFHLRIKVFARTRTHIFRWGSTVLPQVSHLLAYFTIFSQLDLCVESVMLSYLLNYCSRKQIQQMQN